jgi:hypothetical protein
MDMRMIGAVSPKCTLFCDELVGYTTDAAIYDMLAALNIHDK